MVAQFSLNRKRSVRDALIMLSFSAVITAFLSMLSPSTATPAQAHSEPSTCSVTTNATTGYKQIFVGHVKDGESLYRQQNGTSKQIYRGHTYTNRAERVDVYTSNGWTWVCGG